MTSEEEITLYIIYALYLYKDRDFAEAKSILYQIIFERPWLFSQRSYLNYLCDYLLYKYLNCIEF